MLCLSGIGHKLSQHLHGELAGLLVLNNHTEADHVIQCVNSCDQKLDFHAINEMETGMVSDGFQLMSSVLFVEFLGPAAMKKCGAPMHYSAAPFIGPLNNDIKSKCGLKITEINAECSKYFRC